LVHTPVAFLRPTLPILAEDDSFQRILGMHFGSALLSGLGLRHKPTLITSYQTLRTLAAIFSPTPICSRVEHMQSWGVADLF